MSSLVMIKWTIKKGINPTQMQEVATKKRKKKCVHKSPSLYFFLSVIIPSLKKMNSI